MDHIRAILAQDDGESLFRLLPLLVLLLLSALSGLFKKRQQKQQQSKSPKPTAPSPSGRRPETLPPYARQGRPTVRPTDQTIGRTRPSAASGTPAGPGSGRPQPLPATRGQSQPPSKPPAHPWTLPEAIALPEEPPVKTRPVAVSHRPTKAAGQKYGGIPADQRQQTTATGALMQAAAAHKIIQPSPSTDLSVAQAGAYSPVEKERAAQNLRLGIDQNQELIRAMVWAEVLGRPRALKPLDTLDF